MGKDKKIKGYKGFNPDMICRGFQYETGKEYDTDGVKVCERGFHFCENPFDIWGYYPPCGENGRLNRFCEVEGSGDIDNSHSDKIACSHIKINAEIGLQGIINAGVKFIMDKVSRTGSKQSNTGNYSAAANTGYCSAASNTGNYSAASNMGYCSAASNTGYCSAATNTGDCSAASNTGNRSAASVGGRESVAIVTGKDSMAKGAPGCWIVLTERGDWDGTTSPIKEVKAFKVDGEKIKPNTFYKLVNGEAVEVEE